LEHLCRLLQGNINQPGNDIFGKEIIVTQTAGMDAWIKTEIAREKGVFANFSFMNQDTVMDEIRLLLFGERLKNNRDYIRFMVFTLLDHADFREAFPDVARYFEGNDTRRIQLAGRIADLFDQYQLYRAEMIRLWEDDKLTEKNSYSEKWQQWLWKRMGILSREKDRDLLIKSMQENPEKIKNKFKRISLFGISIFTDFHLYFFKELSGITQVDLYICLPTAAKEYKNELLLSFGSKAAELRNMVERRFNEFELSPEENTGETSLNKLQNQILNNSGEFAFLDDGSVSIDSCFTPAREVECLYNYLLDLFDKDRSLKPGDILVMTTDINKYSPFVKAVFKSGPVRIPYQVSGASNNSEETIVSAIELILRFKEEDFTSEKVISLLENKRISKRFQISDFNYLRSHVNKVNIRFGRENRLEDDSRYVSWKYGLEKFILGYAMYSDDEFEASDGLTAFPYKDAEAAGSYDLLHLKAFVDKLESVIDNEYKNRTMLEWKDFLFTEVLAEMIFHDDFSKTDREELSLINKTLSYMKSLDPELKVPFAVFLEELNTKLFTESGEIKLNTGNVTVSSAVPVRGIPFRVICFLGLNYDVFPRKDQFPGFDLLGEEYKEGDRNKNETDKYLFLDTLLSARERLYLSFVGQNVKDNTLFPPSIVIDTLMDYLDCGTILGIHPLHGFSSQYNKKSAGRFFTFLYGGKAASFSPKEADLTKVDEIPVSSFVRFFEHPAEWYFNNVLGIDHEECEQVLPETELFGLGHLEKWKIRNDLLNTDDNILESYIAGCIKEGRLPLKNLGRLTGLKTLEEIKELKDKYNTLRGDKTERNAVIDLSIGNSRFTGIIEGLYGNDFIALSFSDRLVHRVRAWLRTLFLCAQGEVNSSVMIGKDGDLIPLQVLTSEEAISEIRKLLFYFLKGTQAPLKFTVDAAKPPSKTEGISIESILKSIEKDARGNKNINPPIEPDMYLLTLLEEGYFKNFNDNDFREFLTIASLLRLNNDQNEGA